MTIMPAATPQTLNWIRKIGFIGFMFFLEKGLMWLAAPTLLVMFTLSSS